MRLLELFCGTKSISLVAKEFGFDVLTLDNNPFFNADIIADILDVENARLIGFNPDVIWASPPCTTFSVASIGTHWKGIYEPKTEMAKIGIALLEKTINIIKMLKPTYFFIENPRGVMRKVIKDLPTDAVRHTVSYCQYGDTRMKPTDIWTNCKNWIPKTICKNGDSCHEKAPRGAKTGTQGLKGAMERGKIPRKLCEEIIMAVSGKDGA